MRFMVSAGPRTHRWLPLLLAVLLVLPPRLGAQAGAQPAGPSQGQPAAQGQAPAPAGTVQSLRVVPLAGNGETNDLETKVMAPLVVDVLDQNGRPVEGADVIFRFPVSGPSAAFPDKSTFQTVRSNADGQAALVGWMANNQTGSFRVQVTATRGNERGTLVITMTNVTRATVRETAHKSWWSSKWAKIGVIGGGAVAAGLIIWATHNGGGSGTAASGTTVSASPGSPTIGGPH
jgi:hypothetical protein